ncbi:hypothetical protein MNBD_GAMMA20-2281 [hydrothermal vent metagenome]|uniref:Tyr recombinase domain-containing protein n=1 Tax=hydrothermal vent metagenome TaxID=652676 RepID=A0A3B1AI94_9ZZZZ
MILSEGLLQQLRTYWRLYHPTSYLFAGHRPDVPLSVTTAQKAFVRSKRRAGVEKIGGIHALRHAYATHLLEGGLPVGARDLIASLGLPS